MNIDALDKLDGKQRALFAAFQLFLQHGVDGTSIDEVVKVAAISRGGLYHHFASKDELYDAVLELYFLRGYSEFDLAVFDSLPFEAQKTTLTSAISSMFVDVTHRYGVDKARYFALYFDSLSRSEKFRRAVQKFYANVLAALENSAPSKQDAITFMRLVEGEIYFSTIYERTPDFTSLNPSED
ncbi:TetR/AcrR family transcriptional regulator [uncultured Maritalea sp.]|jgi:AcrR family transcriptional regulator|uniref:TetR/AcrR family transcriptional regulator n=1 Tax=uncultured Maritalea sp. TaxID=757249 RepID=UPI0026040609|nr:TetR/AcrR family transcriptional regulator [uncultured Maritalea sp.]